jgi:hypothetical protein
MKLLPRVRTTTATATVATKHEAAGRKGVKQSRGGGLQRWQMALFEEMVGDWPFEQDDTSTATPEALFGQSHGVTDRQRQSAVDARRRQAAADALAHWQSSQPQELPERES